MRNKKIINKGIAALVAGVIIAGASTTNVFAAMVGVPLKNTETSASTSALGNTTGTYRFVLTNGTTSQYCVEGYLYKGANSSSINEVKKKVSLSPGQTFANNYDINQKNYTVAKAKVYGNTKSNPKKGCIACIGISNK